MNKTEILNLIVGDITVAQAKELYDCKWWEQFTKSQAALLQLHQDMLCMPFSLFHEYAEVLLERPVWTHEFAYADTLKKEAAGELRKPSFAEIVMKLPLEKYIILANPDTRP